MHSRMIYDSRWIIFNSKILNLSWQIYFACVNQKIISIFMRESIGFISLISNQTAYIYLFTYLL